MKNIKIYVAFSMALSLISISCNEEEIEPQSMAIGEALYFNLVGLDATINGTFDLFEDADLLQRMNLSGEWTVLAPTEEAWDDFLSKTEYYFPEVGQSERTELTFSDFESDDAPDIAAYILIPKMLSASELNGEIQSFDGANHVFQNGKIVSENVLASATEGYVAQDVNIVESDIDGGINGVIHKIDKVIMPPNLATKPIYKMIEAMSDMSMFVAAIDALPEGNLKAVLKGGMGVYSLYAPDNTAMQAYLDENSYASVADIPASDLESLIANHIVLDFVYSDDITNKGKAEEAWSGNDVYASGEALTSDLDLRTTNGLIHKLNQVVLIK